jgi:ubiquinone/menaquinone biosynthesis C-methylase UbiE
MAWYDAFARIYDRSLEKTYLPFRERAFSGLELEPGAAVLDLACGTGQNLPHLAPRVGADGLVIAADLSSGMLARAAERAHREGWGQVQTLEAEVREVDRARLSGLGVPAAGLDAVVCTLGLSVVVGWEEVLQHSFELLRPGGSYLVMDVISERWNPMKVLVELIARADITRDISGALASHCVDFEREAFDDASPWTFGGTLFVARGRRGG